MARPLRMYRELLRAQRRFPVDAKRAEAQRDMRHLLHGRIRQAFEEGRGASGSRKAELLQHGEAELAALNTITSNHFAQQVRRSRHPRRVRSLTRAVFASTHRSWATREPSTQRRSPTESGSRSSGSSGSPERRVQALTAGSKRGAGRAPKVSAGRRAECNAINC